MEAAKGCTKRLKISRLETCKTCGGTGAKNADAIKTCPDCHGSGQVRVTQRTPFGVINSTRTCSKCSGKGKIISDPCTACNGLGRVRVNKTIEVNIPAGIDDGQTFAVSGQGDMGINGGPAGNLNVNVSVRPDPIFDRDGFDVWCEIPITFTQAVFGDEVVVPTIDGKVKYSIHEGTQPGTTFRLKNKGIPLINGRGRGDQYVKVTIEVPKNLSAKQKDLLKQFEGASSEKNYEKRKGFFDKLKDAWEGKS